MSALSCRASTSLSRLDEVLAFFACVCLRVWFVDATSSWLSLSNAVTENDVPARLSTPASALLVRLRLDELDGMVVCVVVGLELMATVVSAGA